MTLWISDKAIEDLNTGAFRTPLLDDDGEPTGGYLSAGFSGQYPNIHGLFDRDDSDEATIWLDYIEIDEYGDAKCKVSGQDSVFTIYSRKESAGLKRRWEKVE